jgi:hypothetical protein
LAQSLGDPQQKVLEKWVFDLPIAASRPSLPLRALQPIEHDQSAAALAKGVGQQVEQSASLGCDRRRARREVIEQLAQEQASVGLLVETPNEQAPRRRLSGVLE